MPASAKAIHNTPVAWMAIVNAMSDRPQIQFSMRDTPGLPSHRKAGAQALPGAAAVSGETGSIVDAAFVDVNDPRRKGDKTGAG